MSSTREGAARSPLSESAAGRFSAIWQRGGRLVDRLAVSVKEAARAGLLKQALDARERGNIAAAFHLLKEEYTNRPEEPEVAVAFWDVACEYGREAEAARAVAGLIRRHAQQGQADLAGQYWVELTARVEGALADPTALARIVPILVQQVAQEEKAASEREEDDDEARAMLEVRRAALVQAFRAAVSPENTGLTAGVALHLADQAREIDPPSALAAARAALESSELHETKRRRMLELIAEIEPTAAPTAAKSPPAPAPASAPEVAGPVAPAAARSAQEKPAVREKPAVDEKPADVEKPAVDGKPAVDHPAPDEGDPDIPVPRPRPTTEDAADPARAHPLRSASPPRTELSEDELEALRRRLPPSRSATPAAPEESPPAGAPRPGDRRLELHAGRLCSLGDATLVVELDSGRRARVRYESLEAIAVGQIDGLAETAVVVIDLLLNWRSGPAEGQPLRGVRLRLADLDERVQLEKPADLVLSGRDLLHELLDRAPAAPLPGPDAALGGPIPAFDSPADYAREVLGISRI